MVDTVRLGGIKLSGELVQLEFVGDFCHNRLLQQSFALLSGGKVSIPHLHQGSAHGATRTVICIARDDYHILQHTLEDGGSAGWGRLLPQVGTISLFPHGCKLAFSARVIHAFAQRNIPIFGLSTSVSALVVHTKFELLDAAVEAVLSFASLPANHTPLRPVIMLGGEEVETIAVYWEPTVRIYGMELHSQLKSLALDCPSSRFHNVYWRDLQESGMGFKLFTIVQTDPGRIILQCLVNSEDAKQAKSLLDPLTFSAAAEPDGTVECRDVDLVSFHGPHFQDRYGIAELAFRQLMANNCLLYGSACTGTSVQLITPQFQAETVADCLSEKFIVPSRQQD